MTWKDRAPALRIVLCVLGAAAVFVPPVTYQVRHFGLPFTDVGTYVRPMWNFIENGRMSVYSDGTSNFFSDQHFEPFLFVLAPAVWLFGTTGYIAMLTGALAASSAYVYLLASSVCASRTVGAVAAAAYVANPYTMAIALSYRVESFALLFLLAFASYHHVGHDRLAWPCLLLALIVKEDMAAYAVPIALMVATPGRLKATALFIVAVAAYYLLCVVFLWHALYPSGARVRDFYSTEGHPMTNVDIALSVIGRWREFIPLLFGGAGGTFQLTILFAGVFAGWRYLFVCGVMLIWLTYPGGPPRSTLEIYYSYPALLLSFVNLPYALRTLSAAATHLARRLAAVRVSESGVWTMTAVMLAVLAWNLVSHLPGHAPSPIERDVDPRFVYGPGSRVNTPVVRMLIERYLRGNSESVMAQHYTVMSVPQRAKMYSTHREAEQLLQARIRPTFVLLDLGSEDPIAGRERVLAVAEMLRQGRRYRPLWDDQGVLLYRRRD